ncbi:hypothetical protein [Limnoraphis robusta]|uniref:Uncharacterized protein n=1 Tax=Limnoraphis robusta CCNP1315 TaxID=3110306 RepID=A0ABU5TZI2_9CYAN|nr:hypothetical protein [Limnoraphis robusta]MEA5496068.1 hypothetical protein [Limnoraphis robusta BA-68 BA1]MEA5520343.1 hypothetical protein [Limnoraphis robusta CCNP1315]MEA5548340.1 hypothetical protein [Limnoraphis robusta CCNP1324]
MITQTPSPIPRTTKSLIMVAVPKGGLDGILKNQIKGFSIKWG